jgi:squalene-associated FAD-dependent desaturase
MIAEVAVIGGGLSGLAAAIQLSNDGASVTLLEQANKLGGRTYSYVDAKTGDVVDNGQHVLVGAYEHTLRYLRLIGAAHLLTSPQNFHLNVHDVGRGFASFATRFNVPPFNLLDAALRFRLLPFADRLGIARTGTHLRSPNQELEERLRHLTISEWLTNLHQSDDVRRSFWYPIAVSVMNEIPEKASALLFARALLYTFFAGKESAKILMPTVGQSELYVERAKRILSTHRAQVLLNTEVKSMTLRRDKITEIVLKNKKRIRARAFVCAVPHTALGRILPDDLRREPPFDRLTNFASSPIVSMNLWFDRAIMDRDFVGLIGRDVQWIFNRRRIMQEHGKPDDYVSGIISAAHRHVNLTKRELVEIALNDVTSAYPVARTASLLHSVVIKEKRATFSPTTEVEPLRPTQRTSVSNLFLAGDWTDTGLPPTIEGAIMSGFRCADLIRTP